MNGMFLKASSFNQCLSTWADKTPDEVVIGFIFYGSNCTNQKYTQFGPWCQYETDGCTVPSFAPSTSVPTSAPTAAPNAAPTAAPSKNPTNAPTRTPSNTTTSNPTQKPTDKVSKKKKSTKSKKIKSSKS